MSFLDQLKQQADQLRQSQHLTQAERDALNAETERACVTAFRYWVELAKQLNLLQPVPRGRYLIDTKHALQGQPMRIFRADVRKRGLSTAQDLTDHVALYATVGAGETVQVVKDFLPDMQKIEARLDQAGIRYQPESIRNPETGKLVEVRYEFALDVTTGARMIPNHDTATVQFQVNNLEGLCRWVVQFEARQVEAPLLDELAKWLVGQPNDFVKRGKLIEMREV